MMENTDASFTDTDDEQMDVPVSSSNVSASVPSPDLDDFLGKFSTSATEDQEPEAQERKRAAVAPPSLALAPGQHYSRPGAVHVDGISETTDAFSVTMTSDQVPEIHQSRESTQGEYLAEASLVVEPDLVFGEPLEEPKAYWSQPKVQRRAVFVILLVVGMVVGVSVGVDGDSSSASSIFDCSDTAVGCLYTGTQSLGFQDPDSFLVANCMDTVFEIPTNENCDCEVSVPASPFGNPAHCQSCSFVDSADGEWGLAYDCSNLLSGDCVGRDTSNNCISRVRFNTTSELRLAVDIYLDDNSTDSVAARTYGWPIGIWDVSKVQDFSYLFSADESIFSERFNPAAANFNEDITGWNTSSAITMASMFENARSFNQPLADWNVSSVTDMSFMFSRAISFDEPLGEWNVSRVTDMSYAFYSASSFNQPLGDWDVSSVRDVSFMFAYATSFNRSFAAWNISNETDIRGIFTGADGVEVQVQVQHDDFPRETGWTLQDSTGALISGQSVGGFDTPGGTDTKTSYVALGTYTFEMTDTLGDGICCGEGSGSFSIAMNGETVISNDGQFRNIVQETFEVRAPIPSRVLVFETREELREAVGLYLADNGKNTLVARSYGWPIGIWDVSKIQDFSYLFAGPAAANFNEDISGWDLASATNMASMFYQAKSFNQPLGIWNVSSVTIMTSMFSYATSFNRPLGNWNVSGVTDMRSMFKLATSFNQTLADWKVSSATSMESMFGGATSFDQPLGNWDVSSVTDMFRMFEFAASFNQPLADWDVSSVTDLSNTFSQATSFNQSLADWNVSSVTWMHNTFEDATSFNQPLGNWDVSSVTNMTDIFTNSGCPRAEGEESCFYII
jgi:surface protein